MKLQFFPMNAAYAFTFGDALCQLADSPMFFADRRAAVIAAKYRGLVVARNGTVTTK